MESFDYNEKGKEYERFAYADPKPKGYGVLNEKAEYFYSALYREIATRLQTSPSSVFLSDLDSCLNRLGGMLFQSSRIAKHLEDLKGLPLNLKTLHPEMPIQPIPPLALCHPHKELAIDFESLLFHAVATLDHLAVVIADHCIDCKAPPKKDGKPGDMYFSKLKSALARSQSSDVRSEHLFRLICECGD